MSQEWNIRSRGHQCSLCQKPFEDKQSYFSALKEGPEGYERIDCCLPCWKNAARDWTPFSYWKSVYEAPAPTQQKREPVKKETAEDLLRKLLALDDPTMQNVVYVLAVMLEREKQLIERDAKHQSDGVLLRVYEHKKSGDTFLIVDPRLRLDQLGDVQKQVVELLSGTQTLEQEHPPEAEITPPAKNE